MRLPDRKDLLDYAETSAGQDAEVQRQILQLLVSSPLLREQLAELKKDLYLVSAQVPDYHPPVSFAPELARFSQAWLQMLYARKFSSRNFYRSKEFFRLLLMIFGVALLLLGLLGFQLLWQER